MQQCKVRFVGEYYNSYSIKFVPLYMGKMVDFHFKFTQIKNDTFSKNEGWYFVDNVVTFSWVLRESWSTFEDLLACITESLSSKDPEKYWIICLLQWKQHKCGFRCVSRSGNDKPVDRYMYLVSVRLVEAETLRKSLASTCLAETNLYLATVVLRKNLNSKPKI